MAAYGRNTRSQFDRTDRISDSYSSSNEVSLSQLLRQFGQDAASLVRDEVVLARLELRENLQSYARDAARIALAAGAGLLGALALTAFAIIGLGDLLGNYWLSALLVSVVLLAVAGVLAKGAAAHMKRNSLAPRETVQTLKDDQRWAKHEVQDFKQKLKA